MTSENRLPSEYKPINWQNFNRRLTLQEYREIESRAAGLHFAKESFTDDAIAVQGLYLAEALLRELRLLRVDNPFPE
jgi:hypothetical protein